MEVGGPALDQLGQAIKVRDEQFDVAAEAERLALGGEEDSADFGVFRKLDRGFAELGAERAVDRVAAFRLDEGPAGQPVIVFDPHRSPGHVIPSCRRAKFVLPVPS